MQRKYKYLFWLAKRQFLAPKNKNLSFMTRFSVLGVSIGVFALVLVLSVMGGFENELRTRMFEGVSHLEVLSPNDDLAGFSLKNDLNISRLKKIKSFAQLSAFIRSDSVFLKKDDRFVQVTMLGLDPKVRGDVWSFSDSLEELESNDFSSLISTKKQKGKSVPGIVLGESLAFRLNAKVGDIVSALNPQVDSSVVIGGGQASFLFRVTALSSKTLPKLANKFVLTSLEAARKFMPDYDSYLDEENYVTGVSLSLLQPDHVEQAKKEIKKFSKLKVQTWKDVNKTLIFALKLEKYTMGAILLLIILVAAFSISGTLMMTVFHKRAQIAILRSLGLSGKSVLQLHLLHGTVIGLVGAFIGLVFGVALCFFISSKSFLASYLPTWLLVYIYYLPIKFLFFDYLLVGFCAVILSLLAAVYPAKIAANRYPSEDLRSS